MSGTATVRAATVQTSGVTDLDVTGFLSHPEAVFQRDCCPANLLI